MKWQVKHILYTQIVEQVIRQGMMIYYVASHVSCHAFIKRISQEYLNENTYINCQPTRWHEKFPKAFFILEVCHHVYTVLPPKGV